MPDTRWKAHERRAARILGGERVSKHSQGEGGADVVGSYFAYEVKSRASIPAWLRDAVTQAARGSTEGKVGAVAIFEKGKQGGIVVMDLQAFAGLVGEYEGMKERFG